MYNLDVWHYVTDVATQQKQNGQQTWIGYSVEIEEKTHGEQVPETPKVLPPQPTKNKTARDVKKPLQDNFQTWTQWWYDGLLQQPYE